jgi:hypothetical protein
LKIQEKSRSFALIALVTSIVVLGGAASSATKWDNGTQQFCRSSTDTSAYAVSVVLAVHSANDSSALAEYGLPYKLSQASIVMTEATCQAVVSGYNAHLSGADTVFRVASGYVVAAGAAYGLFIPGTTQPDRPPEVAILSSSFQYLFSQVMIR